MKTTITTLAILLLSFFAGQLAFADRSGNNNLNLLSNSNITVSQIKPSIPILLGKIYLDNFDRHIELTAPNGKSFYIIAQNQISNGQLIRSANIIQHYLTNYPNSTYGTDKSKVANQMANNHAILALLNGKDDGRNPIANKIEAQPLFENEIQVEGDQWYIEQDYDHRDASFEEILHWLHDNGIGVDEPDGTASKIGALPEYQKKIRVAVEQALNNKLWGINEINWLEELAEENSLTQEYLAAVIDSYYGLWGAWEDDSRTGMWGLYIAKTREDIRQKDPLGYKLVHNQFFHPYLTYNAVIESDFNGNFSLRFDEKKPYTHHSRYLKDITLSGSNNSSVTVNQLDNYIKGNSGINTIIFSGNASEYTIYRKANTLFVTDNLLGRDGSNRLENIEKLKFSDKVISLSSY